MLIHRNSTLDFGVFPAPSVGPLSILAPSALRRALTDASWIPGKGEQPYVWHSATSALTRHPGFDLLWMNNGGDLLGYFQPDDCEDKRLVVKTRDGRLLSTEPVIPPESLHNMHYLADNGIVFGNLGVDVRILK